jgi:hypothetical protein
MIELAKYILPKMSFDEQLFIKELKKYNEWTKNINPGELKEWSEVNFGNKFGKSIKLVFNKN